MQTSPGISPPAGSASRQTKKHITTALALLVLLSVPEIVVVYLHRAADQPRLHNRDVIPQVTLRGLQSDSLSFSALSGRRAALLFFNVTCTRCQREFLNLDRLSPLFKDKLTVIAVSLSDLESTRYFVETNQLALTTLVDDRLEVQRAFGIGEVPVLVFVNSDGRIREQIIGEQSLPALRKLLGEFAGKD